MKQAVIMARVSSDEQAKGYSLDIQTEKLYEHCRRENIAVVNSYREDHSAKNFNRPEFKRLLTYLKEKKGKVNLLLLTTWDRFSRNLTESFAMIEKLRGYGVEVQAIDQPLDLSIPENQMILAVYLSLPDIDNKRRSIKITEGVRAAKASGRWLGRAPFGYKMTRDEQGKPLLQESEKGAIVKKIFQSIADGKTQAEVREHFKKKGHYFSTSTLSDLLRNKVYTGHIHVKSGEKGEGFFVKGLHPPLIGQELFDRVQDILEGRLITKGFVKAKCFQEPLLLRGLLLCDHCEKKLTGSASKSRNGQRHYYYHCNHCKKVRIPAEEVHDRIEATLKELQIKKEALKLYDMMVKKGLSNMVTKKARPEAVIREEIALHEKRIRNLEDDHSDRTIDTPTFHRSLTRYTGELNKLKEELAQKGNKDSGWEQYLKSGIDLLRDLPLFYQEGSIEVKTTAFWFDLSRKYFFKQRKKSNR